MARWQYNFNSGILESGKTRMAPKNLLKPNLPQNRLGKTGRYLQLRSFTTLLAGGCPKVVILTRLPLAVEMWAQMGHKSFSARLMVGLSECSLLAADIAGLMFKMLLNISAAKHLWKCVVSEAWSSLA